jgi:predicted TIM-barrel fold metal-dependent hydrolase
MKVVDPHIHLCNPRQIRYPWQVNPNPAWFIVPSGALTKAHELPDLLSEAGEVEVLKFVHIEDNADPADWLAEVRWVQSVASDPKSAGRPNGMVAAADLSKPDIESTLEAYKAFPAVRGIRQILNVHRNPFYDFVGYDFLHDPAWQAGFALLNKFDLSFDLQIYPSQMLEAAALANKNPATTLILNHAGMFVDRDTVSGWRTWRDGIRALSACPNITVKISGMGMFDHRWTIESIRPYVLETIDCFGIDRSMFASNFPVDRMFGSYTDLWHAFDASIAGLSETEKEKLFQTNAERVYRI